MSATRDEYNELLDGQNTSIGNLNLALARRAAEGVGSFQAIHAGLTRILKLTRNKSEFSAENKRAKDLSALFLNKINELYGQAKVAKDEQAEAGLRKLVKKFTEDLQKIAPDVNIEAMKLDVLKLGDLGKGEESEIVQGGIPPVKELELDEIAEQQAARKKEKSDPLTNVQDAVLSKIIEYRALVAGAKQEEKKGIIFNTPEGKKMGLYKAMKEAANQINNGQVKQPDDLIGLIDKVQEAFSNFVEKVAKERKIDLTAMDSNVKTTRKGFFGLGKEKEDRPVVVCLKYKGGEHPDEHFFADRKREAEEMKAQMKPRG